MTEPTNEPATPETESPAEAAARKGRGPTRPALLAADIVSDMEDASEEIVYDVVYAIDTGRTAKELRAKIKAARADMAETVKRHEAMVARETAAAEFVERIERLPPKLRRMVALTFGAEEPTSDRFGISGPNVIGEPFGLPPEKSSAEAEVPEGEGA